MTVLGVRNVIAEILDYGGSEADSEALYVGSTLDPGFKHELWPWLGEHDPILQARLRAAGKRFKARDVTFCRRISGLILRCLVEFCMSELFLRVAVNTLE